MAPRYRRIVRTPPPPPPPPPTADEVVADLGEAVAALHDASEAVSLARVQIDKAIRQQKEIDEIAKRIALLQREKDNLEARVRGLLETTAPLDVKNARKHAERMRRAALFWEGEAMKLGHGGRNALRDYHHAKHLGAR